MRKHKKIYAQFSSRFFQAASTILLLFVGVSSHAGSTSARDGDASRISVTAVAGAVDVTMAGSPAAVAPNTTVLLPARILTGNDGNLGLTQAGTQISVASDSDVEIPAEAVDGNLIARLVQHRGNVFYDVAPRDLGKLRVETPLLVAVIKGTQFNVAVQEDSTTISLFEGRLEIRTPDGSDVVQLNAGEIAIRSRVDSSIRVVGMNDERVAAPAARPAVAAAADARAEPNDALLPQSVALGIAGANAPGAATTAVAANVEMKPILDGGTLAAVGGALDVGLEAGADVGAAAVDVSLGAAVDLGGAAVDVALDVGVDLGGGAVDLGLGAGVDLGGAGVDVGLDTGLDLGGGTLDLDLDAGLDLGGTVVDAGVDAGLDLGGALDVGVDTSVDLGGLADTSLDAGLTLDPGTLDLGLDAGLDLGDTLDLGVDLDLGGGTVDLSLDLGGGGPAPPPPGGGLGGLLGGLL